MSVDINVILKKENMPTPEQWQLAIARLEFDLQLDTDFDVEEFSGYLPSVYKGEETGFEYFFGELEDDWLEEDAMQLVGDRDYLVTFSTHSDMRELIASTIASSVLCSITDGLILNEKDGPPFIGAKEAIEYGKKAETELTLDLDEN